ncbi:hypothetical protein MLD52_08010 [Puniceicoccaceae bacterium K14]|nr:hypothetical protein [Puniceicoccaceae bacterium K14]
MSSERKPNTPDMKGAFNAQPKKTPAPKPVSKLESDALKKQREKPKPAPQPTPPGLGNTKAVNDNIRKEREKRIEYINKRLAAQKSRSRDSFKKNSGR